MEGPDFLRQVIDINPHFIFVKDREGRFKLVNEAVAEAYGTTVDGLIGKTDADFNPNAEEVEWFRRDDLEVMDTLREKFIPEEVITDARGNVRYLQTIKRPLVDEDGVARRVLGVATDITALRQAEDTRRRIEAQMQHAQKLESLGVLAGGIAHDFNNLLVGILANADPVKRDLPPGSGGERALEMIRIAARRAAELCRQMLAYSGRGHFVVEAVHINDVVGELRELLGASISKKAALVYEPGDGLPLIEADVSQIRQVVMNLITNASDALLDRGGTIRLRTGTVHCAEYDLEDTCTGEPVPAGDYVFFEVSDTGVGMTPQDLQRIFDPFFTTKVAGRGLGLAAVQGIVRGHGGAIHVRSEPGRGTTFRVMYRVGHIAAGGRPDAAGRHASPGRLQGEPRILVVDDEQIVLAAIRDVLGLEGIEVVLAQNGPEALAILRRDPSRFTGVLLDLSMPRMDGDEVLREIRVLRDDIPVIVMSGFDQREAIQNLSHHLPTGFLQKPFEASALVAAVRSLHEARRGADRTGHAWPR
jgi:PAS domain S-box-containing protein